MAYILAKQSTLNEVKRNLYYLVESYREDGKVKRKKILGLGESRSFDELLERLSTKENEIKAEIEKWQSKMKVNRYWKFQRIAEKWLVREKLRLEKLENYRNEAEKVKQTYKM